MYWKYFEILIYKWILLTIIVDVVVDRDGGPDRQLPLHAGAGVRAVQGAVAAVPWQSSASVAASARLSVIHGASAATAVGMRDICWTSAAGARRLGSTKSIITFQHFIHFITTRDGRFNATSCDDTLARCGRLQYSFRTLHFWLCNTVVAVCSLEFWPLWTLDQFLSRQIDILSILTVEAGVADLRGQRPCNLWSLFGCRARRRAVICAWCRHVLLRSWHMGHVTSLGTSETSVVSSRHGTGAFLS